MTKELSKWLAEAARKSRELEKITKESQKCALIVQWTMTPVVKTGK